MTFPPLFAGKLLRLAAPLDEDRETFARWSRDDAYLRLLDDDPVRPQKESDFDHFRADNQTYFHLRTLDDDTLIGFVVLFGIKYSSATGKLAIGIGDPAYRGKGYGQDALALILNYAFAELNLHRVGLSVMAYNTAAINAYERAGFVHEGTIREMVQREGRRFDLLYYGILRDEWSHRRQPPSPSHT